MYVCLAKVIKTRKREKPYRGTIKPIASHILRPFLCLLPCDCASAVFLNLFLLTNTCSFPLATALRLLRYVHCFQPESPQHHLTRLFPQNEIRIVQASLLGSILANLLLILGMSFLLGGLRFREQVSLFSFF